MSPRALVWSGQEGRYVPMTEQAPAGAPVAAPDGPETVTAFQVHLGDDEIAAAVLRLADHSLVARLRLRSSLGDGAGIALTRAQVVAVKEMLAQVHRALLEAEWQTTP